MSNVQPKRQSNKLGKLDMSKGNGTKATATSAIPDPVTCTLVHYSIQAYAFTALKLLSKIK